MNVNGENIETIFGIIKGGYYQKAQTYIYMFFSKVNQYTKICFSGGVFQNGLLVDLILIQMALDKDLYFHEKLSPNDENISFGQLMYYLNIKSELWNI